MNYIYDESRVIPRQKIEQANTIIMPKFYDSKVEETLMRLGRCLSEPTTPLSSPSYAPKPQKKTFSIFGNMGNGLFNSINIGSNNTTVNATVHAVPEAKKTPAEQKEEEKKKKEEQDQKLAVIIGTISGIVFLVASYFTGKAFAEVDNLKYAEQDMQILGQFVIETDNQKRELEKQYSLSEEGQLKSQIVLMGVRIALNDVIPRLKSYAETAFKAKAFITGAALFTAISAFFKAKQLMGLGGFGVLGGAAVLICNWGKKQADTRLDEDKRSLLYRINTALAIFHTIPKELIAKPVHYTELTNPFYKNGDFGFWANASAPSFDAFDDVQ